MNRRIVRTPFRAARESNRAKEREVPQDCVVNLLQWVDREETRFTVEGEGAEVWCCPRQTFEEHTFAPARAGSG